MESQENAKKIAGEKAAELIQDGMLVGVGTGSTVFYFIKALSLRCKEGLNIKVICSSMQSEKLVHQECIPLLDMDKFKKLDITVDGADEIDPKLNMIKGGGGALLREKILAYHSKEMIVITDESKDVKELGVHPLPIEVIPFGLSATEHHLQEMGIAFKLRKAPKGHAFITDNGNYILDLQLNHRLQHPEEIENKLLKIPGVVETGLFLGMASLLIIGCFNGQIKERHL